MNGHLYIEPAHKKVVCAILERHLPVHSKVWVFGSRAKGNIKKFSDLDLLIDAGGQPLSWTVLGRLTDEFDISDLPYKVDIVDWATVSEEFRKRIVSERQFLLAIS